MSSSEEPHATVVGHLDELDRQAQEFEADRVRRARVADELRAKRAKRVQRQFWFLFAFLTIAFAILAYRTQVNDANLRQAQYNGCVKRADTAVTFNQGRLALINLIVATPANVALTAKQKADMVQQLKDGLILPVEDCSDIPHD